MLSLLFGAAALVHGQGAGHGISKNTYACSVPVVDEVFNFMMTYFPVQEAADDCANRTCTCGKQGRVSLLTGDETPLPHGGGGGGGGSGASGPPGGGKGGNSTMGGGVSSGFGLHCVYAPGLDNIRWDQSGYLSVPEVEQIFVDKFGDMSEWVSEMDTNTGMYTPDLSTFVTPLDDAGEDYLALAWSSNGTDYYSVLVHPGGQIIHEVVGPASTAPASLKAKAKLHDGERWNFDANGGVPTINSSYMSAIWVSHVTTDIERDMEFFKSAFNLTDGPSFTMSTATDPNGNAIKQLLVKISYTSTTNIRLVQPADTTTGEYSIEWWEAYLNHVHKEYMTSPHCGWDVWSDNHFAYDWHRPTPDQADIVAAVGDMGYPYFCVSHDGGPQSSPSHLRASTAGGAHCYICTPFGYQIQLDGTYADPPDTYFSYSNVDLCATYMDYCDA